MSLFVHRTLWRSVEGAGKSKYWITGNLYSQTYTGAISVFDCIRGKGGTTAIILHLGARLRWVVGLKSQPLYTRFPLEGPDGFQSQPGHFGSREKSRVPTRNKTKFFLSPGRQPRYCTDCATMAAYRQKKMHFSVAFLYRITTACFSTKRRDWKQVPNQRNIWT